MNRVVLLGGVLAGVLVVLLVAFVLWRRFYRDEGNAARRILKNSTVPLAARLIVRALDLGFALVLYSTLPPEAIGPYTLAALLVAQYLNTFSEFGLGVLLTRDVARDPTAARHLFGITLLLRWLLVLVCVPLAALLIGGYGLLGSFNLGEALSLEGQQVIWILLLTLVPGAYSGAVTALFNAAERMEVPAVVELVTAMLSIVLRVAVLLLGFGIIGLAWVAVVVSTLTALVYLWLQPRYFFPPTVEWDMRQGRSLVYQAFPLMLNNLLSIVFFRFDMFIIKGTGGGNGDVLVTQYNVAYQVLSVALILPPVITFAVFPMLSRRADGARDALAFAQNRTLGLLLMLAFPIAMGITVLAPDFVRLFTRSNADQYLPISAEVLAILAWFLPLSFVNGLLQYVLIAINRQYAITRAFLIGAVFNLLANLALIPLYGLYAASVVTILSEVVLLAVFLPLLVREGLTPPLLRLMWQPAVAAAVMGGGMWLALGVGGWLLAAVVAAPLYLVTLWAVGGIGATEWALVLQVLGRGNQPAES